VITSGRVGPVPIFHQLALGCVGFFLDLGSWLLAARTLWSDPMNL